MCRMRCAPTSGSTGWSDAEMMSWTSWWGADVDWRRPGPTRHQKHVDVYVAVAFFIVASFFLEALGSLETYNQPGGALALYAGVASAALMLVFRRSYPMLVAWGLTLHLLFYGTIVPLSGTLPMQVLYFYGIYSGLSWASDRRQVPYHVLGISLAFFGWMTWFFAWGSGVDGILSAASQVPSEGWMSPTMGAVALVVANNVAFFVGAMVLGQVAWNGAYRTAQVLEQNETIAHQAASLTDQAVVNERIRIARELHDVVAHHVSVMGVQAAAARRLMKRSPDEAEQALASVEDSSREAVGQMRDLLGTLRTGNEGEGGRTPQPTFADLPDLAQSVTTEASSVAFSLVENEPGDADKVPAPVQLCAYRIVQEALSNVRRHSTGKRTTAVIRVDGNQGSVEVDVTNDGQPRIGTSGSGWGHQGMRERVEHLGGEVEVGPRSVGGYRVVARMPLSGVRR